jgi:hypothetical protein
VHDGQVWIKPSFGHGDTLREATVKPAHTDAGGTMITRRSVLASTGGLVAVAAASAAGQPANAATQRRIEAMQITRAGSQPSSKGSAEYFTGTVRIDPLFPVHEPAQALRLSLALERLGTRIPLARL